MGELVERNGGEKLIGAHWCGPLSVGADRVSELLRKHERRRPTLLPPLQSLPSPLKKAHVQLVNGLDYRFYFALVLVYFVMLFVDPVHMNTATRPERPDVIVLENGATTFVSSLEEHMITQTEEPQTRPDDLTGSPSATPSPSSLEAPTKERQNSTTNKNAKLAIIFTDIATRDTTNSEQSHTTKQEHEHDQHQQQHHEKQNHDQSENHNQNQHGHSKSHGEHTTTTGNQTQKPIPQHWQVKSLLNVTHDYPLAYSQIICGYVWPFMAALTLFTNLMIVFVLSQQDMRTPTNVVLTAIAIADIIPIVVPVPWFVYLFAMGNEKQVLYPPIICYLYQHSTRSVSEIFYFLSTWLNVLLAIQDYLVACRPKLAQKYCKIRVVIVEIILLTFLAFLLNLPQALKLVFKPVRFYYNGQLTYGCKALQARWFKDWVGEHVALYDDIFTAIIVLFVDGGPAVVLITLTALLIRQLQRQRIQGHLLMEQARTASKRRRERHRQQEYESSARVMIFVLLAFLAVKIPFATTYTLMIIQSRFEIHFVESLLDFQKAITITDLVFVLSYPINFTIFCCCSKKFRHKCVQLLGECNHNTKHTRDRFMSSFNSDSFIGRRLSSLSSGSKGISTTERSGPQRDSTVSFMITEEENRRDKKLSVPETISSMGSTVSPSDRAPSKLGELGPDRADQSQLAPIGGGVGDSASGSGSAVILNVNQHCAMGPNYHHHQPDQSSEASLFNMPPSPQLKSLIENGSLCLECVMRYEQLKSICLTSQTPVQSPSWTAQQQQQQQQQQLLPLPTPPPLTPLLGPTFVNRDNTSSSDSSPALFVLPPAPPPPRSLASLLQERQKLAKGLPQIITTTCESISEQQSDTSDCHEDDENSREKNDEMKKNSERGPEVTAQANQSNTSRPDQVDSIQQEDSKQQIRQTTGEQSNDEPEGGTMPKTSGFGAVDQLGWRTGSRRRHDEQKWQANDVRRSSSRSSDNQVVVLQQRDAWSRASDYDLGSSSAHHHLVRPMEGQTDTISDSSLCDQASGSAGTRPPLPKHDQRQKRRAGDGDDDDSFDGASLGSDEARASSHDEPDRGRRCFVERETSSEHANRRGRKPGGHQADHLSLTPLDERKRSLSLSNSNLTTLPNATGMLADVLVSVLFGGGSASGQQQGNKIKEKEDTEQKKQRKTKHK
uniref:G-protein coupled receptors family 1 profile domain-containing protein n=1 Tax=Aceria tosichella TaxID=561515 RepID=A0A6G1SR59_9ACAR